MANGLFQDPAILQQMLDRENAIPRPAPRNNIEFLAQRAGRGLRGLFDEGKEDPRLRQARERVEAVKGVDMSNPQAIRSAAEKLSQAGDLEAAIALIDRANKLSQQTGEIGRQERKLSQEDKRIAQAGQRIGQTQEQIGLARIKADRSGRLTDQQILESKARIRQMEQKVNAPPAVKIREPRAAEVKAATNQLDNLGIDFGGDKDNQPVALNLSQKSSALREQFRSIGVEPPPAPEINRRLIEAAKQASTTTTERLGGLWFDKVATDKDTFNAFVSEATVRDIFPEVFEEPAAQQEAGQPASGGIQFLGFE